MQTACGAGGSKQPVPEVELKLGTQQVRDHVSTTTGPSQHRIWMDKWKEPGPNANSAGDNGVGVFAPRVTKNWKVSPA